MPTAPQPAEMALLLLILGLATYSDLRHHRIPNAVSLGGVAAALILYSCGYGSAGAWMALGGMGVGLGLFLPFYLLGGMGAGDVKLMATAGAFLGPTQTAHAVVFSLVAGGVLALIVLCLRSRWASSLMHDRPGSIFLPYSGRFGMSDLPQAAGEAAAARFPYALAITLGTVAALGMTLFRTTSY